MARRLNHFFIRSYNGFCSKHSGPFTFMDIFLTFLSIGSFFADIGTDVIVIIQYYLHGHIVWMLLTTGLVSIPSLIVQIFSIRWYIIDETISNLIWTIHVLQLGVFHRYIKLLSLGLKIRKKYTQSDLEMFHQQQSDICMLRLFESFMESAPQLVLQLYIMVSTDEWNPWTAISAIASIFSLSWGIAAYSKAMRNVLPEKNRLSWWGLLFQSLWRIGMVSSRVFSMVLFAAAYGSWLILAMVIHWIGMTAWVLLQKTDFCSTMWEERLYNGVVGVIYCFCYFNIKEGRSRFRMSLYYFLTIVQNICYLLAFYVSDKPSEGLIQLVICLVPSGIIIGTTSMLIYYRFFHPSGPIEMFSCQSPLKTKEEANSPIVKQCICCTLKTCRKFKDKENKVLGISQQAPNTSAEHFEQINKSITSVHSIQDNKYASDLHRSHSLNCSYSFHDMLGFNHFSIKKVHHRKSLANHHRTVNYHFRPAVINELLSSKVHCSCLVLMQNTDQKKDCESPFFQHSKSMPNLEGSFESSESIQSFKSYHNEQSFSESCSNHISSTYEYRDQSVSETCSCRSNSISSEHRYLPVINSDHVIQIVCK